MTIWKSLTKILLNIFETRTAHTLTSTSVVNLKGELYKHVTTFFFGVRSNSCIIFICLRNYMTMNKVITSLKNHVGTWCLRIRLISLTPSQLWEYQLISSRKKINQTDPWSLKHCHYHPFHLDSETTNGPKYFLNKHAISVISLLYSYKI